MYPCKTTFPPTSGTDHVLSDVAAGVLHGAAGALGCVIYVTVMFLDLDVRQPVHITRTASLAPDLGVGHGGDGDLLQAAGLTAPRADGAPPGHHRLHTGQ